MTRILTVFAVLTLLTGQLKGQHKEFSWLIGTWKVTDKNMFETWSRAGDHKSLNGTSYKVSASDTTVLEQTRIVFKQNSFYYIADVSGNQAPVNFAITWFDGVSFVAENPQHDFPKVIRYKLVRTEGKEFINASIEGDGKVVPYTFEKIQ
jgi:hypothetical protein